MKKFVSFLLAALVAVGIPFGTCLTSSATGARPDAPKNLSVLEQSVTDAGFTLVWDKPDNYSGITDYEVKVVKTSDGTTVIDKYASDTTANQSSATSYIKQFYDNSIGDVKDSNGNTKVNAYKISKHTFVVKLPQSENTDYTVTVQSVGSNGLKSEENDCKIDKVTTANTPTNVIDITKSPYNAVADGVLANDSTNTASTGTVNTTKIQAAIDACPAGGTVVVPDDPLDKDKTHPWIFVTGPITLKSDITLDVEGTLLASPNPDAYTNPYPNDKTQVGQKSASLISTVATDANGNTINYQNIRIVGGGTINGNGWQTNTGKTTTKNGVTTGNSTGAPDTTTTLPITGSFAQYAAGKVDTSKTPPVYTTLSTAATNHLAYLQFAKYLTLYNKYSATPTANNTIEANAYSTRSNLIVINNTTNAYVGDGITATNPSQHTIGFTNCSKVVVNGLIASTYDCNNGDGINFTNSTDLTVVNSVFNTGDDCINFNAGVGLSAESNLPTGNAKIFDNYFGRGHGAIAMGSNTAAWIENITAEDNVCNGTAIGLRGKSQSGNGGGARNIVFRDSALANITDSDGSAFLFTDSYAAAAATPGPNWAPDEPTFHDIQISNCTVNTTKKYAIVINGASNGYDYNINFDNIAFGGTTFQTNISYARNCMFKDVVFYSKTQNYDGTQLKAPATDLNYYNPWSVTNSRDLSFTGTTTAPLSTMMPSWATGSTVTATNVTDSGATLTWSAATDSNLTNYVVMNGTTALATVDGNTKTCNVTGLAPGTQYKLTVCAVNSKTNMASSPSVSVTTTGKYSVVGTTTGGVTSATIDDISSISPDSDANISLGDVTVQVPQSVLKGFNAKSLTFQNTAPTQDEQNKITTLIKNDNGSLAGSFSLSLTGDGTAIHELNGNVTVTVKLSADELSKITDFNSVKLYYYNPSTGALEDMKATFDSVNKTVTFTTNHFSTYVIEQPLANPKTGDTFPIQLPIMLSVTMIAVLVGVKRMRRHA